MKTKLLIFAITLLLMSSFIYADASQSLTFNSTSSTQLSNTTDTSASSNLKIKEIRQDPFPVNPGEYTDIYMKLENYGASLQNPRFEFVLNYPLTLDQSLDAKTNMLSIDTGEKRTFHYKLRVDQDALPGDYEVEYRAYITSSIYFPYFFNVKVDDVTSNFDVAITDVSASGVSIGLANTGSNDAKSITMTIDKQTDFDLVGYKSYIIGNLNSGDDTSTDVLVLPKSYEMGKELKLKLTFQYTDILGHRRTVIKDAALVMTPQAQSGFEALKTKVYALDTKGNSSSSMFWTIGIIILVLVIIFFYFRRRNKKKK
jgi:uncharacterized membrane protein